MHHHDHHWHGHSMIPVPFKSSEVSLPGPRTRATGSTIAMIEVWPSVHGYRKMPALVVFLIVCVVLVAVSKH
eukprot:2560736-Rhodomonas_salina.2